MYRTIRWIAFAAIAAGLIAAWLAAVLDMDPASTIAGGVIGGGVGGWIAKKQRDQRAS
jgi:hypothetical protein